MFERGDHLAIRLLYSIKDFSLEYPVFKNLLEDKGFGEFSPRRRTKGEIFESVTGRISNSRGRIYQIGNLRWSVFLLEVNEGRSNIIERVILAAAVDRQKKKATDGDKVARLLFDKDTGEYYCITQGSTLSWAMSGMEKDLKPCPPFLQSILDAIPDNMIEESGRVSSSQIRNCFQKIVSSVGIPIEDIRGAWILPKGYETMAEAFGNTAKAINDIVGRRVIRVDLSEVSDDKAEEGDLAEDAVIFATKEFEQLLLKEEERIEFAADPEEAQKKAASRFAKEAGKVMALIRKHKATLGDSLARIETVRKRFEDTLQIFEVTPCEHEEESLFAEAL